jgi:hypothetical protein
MSRQLRLIGQILVLVLGGWGTTHAALTVQGYQPALHDRFANDPSFIGAQYDWSGVGRTTARWGTLISPSFIVSVNHFPPSGTIRFYHSNDPNGSFEERTIVQSSALQQNGKGGLLSDVRLSRLDAPVSSNTTFYPILSLPNTADYINQTIYVFGRSNATTGFTTQRLGRNQIDAVFDIQIGNVRNDAFIFDYDNPGGVGADEARVEVGDSGAPSFIIVNGKPALVGVHWFNYENDAFDGQFGRGSGDSFISLFVNELNTAMAAMGSNERVTVVPEPGAWIVVLAGTILASVRRRRFAA